MNEFQFDLESLSELGLAPELLLPEDDLLLGLQDGPPLPNVQRSLKQEASVPELENTFLDLSSDLFSFLEMTEIPEVTEPTVEPGHDSLYDVIEECGIGSPTSSLESRSPAPSEVETPCDMEQTQSLIDEVENYLKSVKGTATVVEDSTPITVQGNPALMDHFPTTVIEVETSNLTRQVKQDMTFIEQITTQSQAMSVIEQVTTQSQPMSVIEYVTSEPQQVKPAASVIEHVATQEVSVPTTNNQSTEAILQALISGNVSLNDSGVSLTEADLSRAVTTTMVTEEGENVIIIIAPPSAPASPAHSYVTDYSFMVPDSPVPSISPGPSVVSMTDYDSSYDTDPDYSPSYSPKTRKISDHQSLEQRHVPEEKPRRKYQRRIKPEPPKGPYPLDKKERKKAQNRTAAFRYREKKKQEQDIADLEVDKLVQRNAALRTSLGDVENELRMLKKLMSEAGLGKYANAANI